MKTILNIRIEQGLKTCIEKSAKEEGITPSEFARNVLNDYLDYSDEDTPEIQHLGTVVIPYISEFHKDKEFIMLLNWLYAKAIFPNSQKTRDFVSGMKIILEKAMADYEFSHELRFEFLKVLNDINRYLVEPDDNYKQFHFCYQGNLYAFNYSLLISEVWRVTKMD